MTKRETNHELMVHWAQEWTTLGQWQALNARLAKSTALQDFDCASSSAWPVNDRSLQKPECVRFGNFAVSQ
jgi:hypothetical protein